MYGRRNSECSRREVRLPYRGCLLLAHRDVSLRCEGSDAIEAKRTCRERRERVDLTKMTHCWHELSRNPASQQSLPCYRLRGTPTALGRSAAVRVIGGACLRGEGYVQ